jgi:hypothetical protein
VQRETALSRGRRTENGEKHFRLETMPSPPGS